MKNKYHYSNELVLQVSSFLQECMNKQNITSLTADEAAELLASNKILPNNVGPKPGFNFRQLLRNGRDGKNALVTGALQIRPNTRWVIQRI